MKKKVFLTLIFLSLLYAGIKWTASQGNPGVISDAKDQITQALWGLVLLGGAFVILNTINPELTILQIPKLSQIVSPTSTTAGEVPQYACKVDGAAVGDSCFKTEDCDGVCSSLDPRATCEPTITCGAKCDPQTLAQKNNTAYPARNSSELQNVMGCIQGKVGSIPGSKFTYDIDHSSCNYTRGTPGCEPSGRCSHTKNSCHYGGSSGSDGALAVDYGGAGKSGSDKAKYFEAIVSAANQCGAKSGGARCENAAGQKVGCADATHVHVSAAGCDRN
ncbi:MAG: hypothetical protein LiPW15_749 [Parcubacteria group bacterium LiPW_15]|nr:MAG: hypothetical protein LiPW15_749 [Parcubacteria group bacterium LiPW_15]